MKKSLNTFVQQVDLFLAHIKLLTEASETMDYILQQDEVSDENKERITRIFKDSNEKILEYNSNVISLYGYWEQFVERIIQEYVNEVNKSDNCPKIDSQKYKDQIIQLFGRLSKGNPKFEKLTDENLIQSLYSVVVNNKNEYIPHAFFQSGGNYNFKETANCFKAMGFTNFDTQLKFYPPLDKYFKQTGETENLYLKLDNLVKYRNEVAHGSVDNILGPEEFIPLAEFMKILARTINLFLTDNINLINWNGLQSPEFKINNYYGKTGVYEIKMSNEQTTVNTSMPIYYNTNNDYPRYGHAKIKSIIIDDKNVNNQVVTIAQGQLVTMVLDKNINKNSVIKFSC